MIDSSFKNANILIVDDQVANIDVLEGFLSMQGYLNIKTTTDPREVISLFASFNPDLILLDLSMPYLTGFEVMEQLKSINSLNVYLPILVLTADVTNETKQRALSVGANDFLTKPFDLIEVGLRIKNLLYSNYLQQQLQHHNHLLEKRVQERTVDLVLANKELMVAKDKAEASDRLKTAFMHNISHEVRTPLNGILGFAGLLADSNVTSEQKQKYLPLLEFSSNRLLNTITDYMDISLIASDNMVVNYKLVRLFSILEEVRTRFQDLSDSKNINLDFKISDQQRDFEFQSDPVLLKKIISHLLDNAIKFTQNGSVIFGFSTEHRKIEFYVKDTGIGIAKESQELVFEAFAQEEIANTRGYEGSGLGLSVIKGMVKLLDGKIRLESEKGLGSTFFVTLPIRSELDEIVDNRKQLISQKSEELPIILIVEDDFANYSYIEAVLENHVTKILYARNGNEAVEICRNHPEISIVLMDVKMPVMNGFEATREIKTFRKELPVIAITAYAMTGDESKVFEAGCDDYLPKPTNSEHLLSKIKQFGFKV